MKERKANYIYMEYLRVLCAFKVIMIHVSGADWFKIEIGSPDGHDVGCTWTYYMDNEVGKTLFMKECKDICSVDGKPHDIKERQYCGDGHYRVLCSKCHKYMDMNGHYSGNVCAIVDANGNYQGMAS